MIIFSYALFLAAIILLMLVRMDSNRSFAVIIALVGAIAASYITSFRTIYPEDDIINYYELFTAVSSGDWRWLEQTGGGVEFGLPFILQFLNIVIGDLSLQSLLFCLTLSSTSLAVIVYAWIIPRASGPEHFGLKLGFVLAYISFFTASHTTRQFLAGVALLPILALPLSPLKTFGWTLVAFVFHTTSVLFAAIITLCRSNWGTALMCLLGTWIIVSIDTFVLFLQTATPTVIQNKLILLTIREGSNLDISNIPDLVRLSLLAGLVFGTNYIWRNSVPVWTRRYVYINTITFAILVNVPFVGVKLSHMLLNVAFGLIVMMCVHRNVAAMRVLVAIGAIYQFRLLTLY